MRPAQEGTSGYSATPIYDALYSEYLRSFRTLPGDRTGEEDLGFKGFGAAAHGPGRGSPVGSYAGHTGQVGHASGATSGSGYPSPYPGYAAARPSYGTGHVPAALPPAPRRGL
ncbi:hypothetical protein ACFPM3_09925 [Streptomyces coeruleoprunus]|uniref:Uncharacterized protein n=1 Tax=Streptomyces coeruleoprunus TaxID=285563 RepID=A0ABV9XE52_9ACTN